VSEVGAAVTACGEAARAGAAALASAPAGVIDEALRGMATLLTQATGQVLDANAADVAAGQRAGLGAGLLDRLQLDEDRIAGMAGQIGQLAAVPFPPAEMPVRDLPGGLRLAERRIPVGVIGANYEARPNVTVDIASQLLKSRNAGVLRTGGAALRSAAALFDHVIVPAVAAAGLDPRALQLVRSADRAAATELVRRPGLIPLVILRGSGTTTRDLAAEAARHGVRTLAHADGGGVLYLDAAADPALTAEVIGASLDRLDDGREATVTVAPVTGPEQAARIANEETSGLAASVITADAVAAGAFLAAYAGTGAFWNASTRLLDGFKLRGVPETGINVDHVPGPRGPVTFPDLCLRQYVVTPAEPVGA